MVSFNNCSFIEQYDGMCCVELCDFWWINVVLLPNFRFARVNNSGYLLANLG